MAAACGKEWRWESPLKMLRWDHRQIVAIWIACLLCTLRPCCGAAEGRSERRAQLRARATLTRPTQKFLPLSALSTGLFGLVFS